MSNNKNIFRSANYIAKYSKLRLNSETIPTVMPSVLKVIPIKYTIDVGRLKFN